MAGYTRTSLICFHSLQTGKRIQRRLFRRPKCWHKPGFHSLQTGKRIQRDPILSPVGPWVRTPKTKHEVRKTFFSSKFSPQTPTTPRVHSTKHDFFVKTAQKPSSHWVLGHFSPCRSTIGGSRRVLSLSIRDISEDVKLFPTPLDRRQLAFGCAHRFARVQACKTETPKS